MTAIEQSWTSGLRGKSPPRVPGRRLKDQSPEKKHSSSSQSRSRAVGADTKQNKVGLGSPSAKVEGRRPAAAPQQEKQQTPTRQRTQAPRAARQRPAAKAQPKRSSTGGNSPKTKQGVGGAVSSASDAQATVGSAVSDVATTAGSEPILPGNTLSMPAAVSPVAVRKVPLFVTRSPASYRVVRLPSGASIASQISATSPGSPPSPPLPVQRYVVAGAGAVMPKLIQQPLRAFVRLGAQLTPAVPDSPTKMQELSPASTYSGEARSEFSAASPTQSPTTPLMNRSLSLLELRSGGVSAAASMGAVASASPKGATVLSSSASAPILRLALPPPSEDSGGESTRNRLTKPEAQQALGRLAQAAAEEKLKMDALTRRLTNNGFGPEPDNEVKLTNKGFGPHSDNEVTESEEDEQEKETCVTAIIRRFSS
mmetsp:Transcript_7531/g.19074  ORF Transcript_7531/g.19074 Transcript_7531/m.19074 type:complete len:425 (-) Transcript_7531:8-1282(-)